MENILTDTKQLEKDNNMLKTELDNRIEDLAKQSKAGGDNKVTYAQILGLMGDVFKSFFSPPPTKRVPTNVILLNLTFYDVLLKTLAKSC